jgi:gamma-glutamyltranspeptidase/glutathione hydrolase
MVVAAHPLAARVGLDVLKRGGNAVDASIATALALNAAEPFASGIGGGGFMVIHLARTQRTTVINYREKAPAAARPEMFLVDGRIDRRLSRTHGLAVAVPGALAGWTYALETYGSWPLADVIPGAVAIAEQGFPVSATFSKINKDEYEKLILNAGEESCYLNQSFPYEPGDVFRNPELARLFRRLAVQGPEDFYAGETAAKIVDAVKAKGGILTREDLAAYRPVEHAPLTGSFRDYTFTSTLPPSCGGIHTLQLLNIAENWPLADWRHNSPEYIHHLAEAFRFVFADKIRYMGDPDFTSVPVRKLISKAYARRIVQRIQPGRTAGDYPAEAFASGEDKEDSANTTHLCVVDKDGNIVSLTQSINHFFGSGIVPEGTGFLLNNHMDDFDGNPQSPNAPGPHKRPVSNMGPLLVFRNGRPVLALGSPGGTRIFTSLTQIILNITEFRMSLDESIEAPRFFSHSVRGKARAIAVENRIPESVRTVLASWGHEIDVRDSYDKYFGGAQAIMILPGPGIILGGADSRRDGFGIGYRP